MAREKLKYLNYICVFNNKKQLRNVSNFSLSFTSFRKLNCNQIFVTPRNKLETIERNRAIGKFVENQIFKMFGTKFNKISPL